MSGHWRTVELNNYLMRNGGVDPSGIRTTQDHLNSDVPRGCQGTVIAFRKDTMIVMQAILINP